MLYSSDPQEAKRKEWRRQHRRWYDAYARLLAAGVPIVSDRRNQATSESA